jgi:predicted  nucleic acid-binding Zn-ribbon protein
LCPHVPMNDDLTRLIELQRLDSTAQDAERRIAEEPERHKALDARLEAARQRVASAKQQLTENQSARRVIEKDVAVHQGRLSKFRDQAMAVKTNQEYHAIQHEIAFAQTGIKELEDAILERMMEADELTATLKRAEIELAAEQKKVEAETRALAAEQVELKAVLEKVRVDRAAIVAGVNPHVLTLFEMIARRRNGVAMSEAKGGVCTICHVRLRPQVFNTVLKNEEILQCDHCNRILYYVPVPATAVDTTAASS